MSNKKRRYDKFGEDNDGTESSDDESYEKRTKRDMLGPMLPSHLLNERSNTTIGPDLPPHLRQSEGNKDLIGPCLPPGFAPSSIPENDTKTNIAIGPCLPPGFHASQSNEAPEERCDDIGPNPAIGPALPPHLIGPKLPPNLQHLGQGPSVDSEARILGPNLPPGFTVPPEDSEESEDESFGPDPRLMHSGDVNFDAAVAERAERARRKMLGLDEKKVERESWMLELPPEKAATIGLGPRQFRAKLAPDLGDRTVWTDTPNDAAKKVGKPPKQDDKALIKQRAIAERDEEMDKLARKAEKKAKRDKSLLEMHSSKLKEKAKEESKAGQPAERKRFNREEDMQVHRFDEAQKKAIFKKAQMLNDRFSKGESKYL